MKRLGPKMSAALAFIAANPGISRYTLAQFVGYRTIERVIEAGLVGTVEGPRGGLNLYPKEKESKTQCGMGKAR